MFLKRIYLGTQTVDSVSAPGVEQFSTACLSNIFLSHEERFTGSNRWVNDKAPST